MQLLNEYIDLYPVHVVVAILKVQEQRDANVQLVEFLLSNWLEAAVPKCTARHLIRLII